MEVYLLITILTFLVTFITYFIVFYQKAKENGDISLFLKGNAMLSLSVAFVLTILMKLISAEIHLTTLVVFLMAGFTEYNIFRPILFKEEYFRNMKKVSIIAVITSKSLIFAVLFLIQVINSIGI